MSRWKSAFLWAGLGFALAAAAMGMAIARSTSSTAAIGIIFIPFSAAIFSIPFFIFGSCVPDLLELFRDKFREQSIAKKLRAVTALGLAVCGLCYAADGIALTIVVNNVQKMNGAELDEFLAHSMFRKNKFALGALAQNPKASAEILDRVARIPNPELHHRMGSLWPVMGGNTKGLAVMRLIAMHPSVSAATLSNLSSSPDEYVRHAVLSNPKTPDSVIHDASGKRSQLTDWALASSPKTSVDILKKLAETGDEYTRSNIARNRSTPVEMLAKLANDPVWHVRRDVVANPHTPAETIASLVNDPDERVRELVAYQLRQGQKRGN
ncbi:MAG: hypothetical protein HZC54_23700 [Verrucomicrobia bacterium]|nr:hypothetical protein [Verrucomicrobiota bacterium]